VRLRVIGTSARALDNRLALLSAPTVARALRARSRSGSKRPGAFDTIYADDGGKRCPTVPENVPTSNCPERRRIE